SPLANDAVPAGSTITSINGTPVVVGTPIAVPNGSVVVNADGTVTFTPDAGYTGPVEFPYEVTTPDGVVVSAKDTINIYGATDDSKDTLVNQPVTYNPLTNDKVPPLSTITSINGKPVTIGNPIEVENGTVVVNPDNTITFTPKNGYTGEVKFPYEVTTPDGTVVKAIDTILVAGPILPAVPIETEGIVTLNLLDDVIAPKDSKIVRINGIPVKVNVPFKVQNGTVNLNPDGTISFTPDPGFVGLAEFDFEVETPSGLIIKGNKQITIKKPNTTIKPKPAIQKPKTPRTGGELNYSLILLLSLIITFIVMYNKKENN
ncbi:MAG: Ig-like domain-containing protein, partial [Patescibacteria group bacterium]